MEYTGDYYQQLAEAEGISREEAKRKYYSLLYGARPTLRKEGILTIKSNQCNEVMIGGVGSLVENRDFSRDCGWARGSTKVGLVDMLSLESKALTGASVIQKFDPDYYKGPRRSAFMGSLKEIKQKRREEAKAKRNAKRFDKYSFKLSNLDMIDYEEIAASLSMENPIAMIKVEVNRPDLDSEKKYYRFGMVLSDRVIQRLNYTDFTGHANLDNRMSRLVNEYYENLDTLDFTIYFIQEFRKTLKECLRLPMVNTQKGGYTVEVYNFK